MLCNECDELKDSIMIVVNDNGLIRIVDKKSNEDLNRESSIYKFCDKFLINDNFLFLLDINNNKINAYQEAKLLDTITFLEEYFSLKSERYFIKNYQEDTMDIIFKNRN